MKVLIDGYNLIFAWGWMPRTGRADASKLARAKLIERLKQLIPPQDRSRITLVFDVRGSRRASKENGNELDSSGFQILFASEHPDADDLIVELIRKEPNAGSLVVVSSDLQIKTAASRRNVLVVNSEECLDELPMVLQSGSGRRTSEAGSAESATQNGTEREKAIEELSGIDWMKEFGLNDEGSDPRGSN